MAEKYLSISFLGEGGDHNTWAGLTLVFDNVRTLSCFILSPDTEKIAARPREAGVVVVSVFKMVFRDCFFFAVAVGFPRHLGDSFSVE